MSRSPCKNVSRLPEALLGPLEPKAPVLRLLVPFMRAASYVRLSWDCYPSYNSYTHFFLYFQNYLLAKARNVNVTHKIKLITSALLTNISRELFSERVIDTNHAGLQGSQDISILELHTLGLHAHTVLGNDFWSALHANKADNCTQICLGT